jgi:hypothetical protein
MDELVKYLPFIVNVFAVIGGLAVMKHEVHQNKKDLAEHKRLTRVEVDRLTEQIRLGQKSSQEEISKTRDSLSHEINDIKKSIVGIEVYLKLLLQDKKLG